MLARSSEPVAVCTEVPSEDCAGSSALLVASAAPSVSSSCFNVRDTESVVSCRY